MAEQGEQPRKRIRPISGNIVDPDAPQWVALWARSADGVLFSLFLVWVLILGVVISVWPVIGLPLAGLSLGIGLAATKKSSRHVLSGHPPLYKKVPITGQPLGLLGNIQAHLEYARTKVAEVPTGLDWREIESDVQALLWDSAANAARASAMAVEINDLKHATPGTPQAALKASLRERRGEILESLRTVEAEAEGLAQVAGNAAAAAKLALLRTGDLRALEVVTPTARSLKARDTLADARARLELLAEVWSTLDENNAALSERVEEDLRRSRRADQS